MQALRANRENRRKEEPSVQEPMDVEQAHRQSFEVGTQRQEAASLFSPDLVPVTPACEGKGCTLEGDSKDCIKRNGEHGAELSCATRQKTSKGTRAVAEQVASGHPVVPSRMSVSTDDLLDCLVNPQVTRMVAQLLIQGKSL